MPGGELCLVTDEALKCLLNLASTAAPGFTGFQIRFIMLLMQDGPRCHWSLFTRSELER